MPASGRPSSFYSSRSTPYPSFTEGATITRPTSGQGPSTGRKSNARSRPRTAASTTVTSRAITRPTSVQGPSTARKSNARSRPRTAAPTTVASREHQFLCAISESRGLSPIVGLAFIDCSTNEAVLCQISDNQTFVRTIHKLFVYQPTEILFMSTAAQPKSQLYSIIEANLQLLPQTRLVILDRKYWSETTGNEYIEKLALRQDLEAIKVSVGGNFYATCCIAAALSYIELQLTVYISPHSLRIKYEPSEGSMMIDLSTIHSLELIQNLQHAKSKDCLFGILNQTLTPMGARLLRSNLLQPLMETEQLEDRYDAVGELSRKEDVFFAVRQALTAFVDADRVLTAITVIPTKPSKSYWEQSINNVIMLKQYVKSIPPVHDALGATESILLRGILELCAPEKVASVQALIDDTINPDIAYQKKPLDLRNQRTYAVKSRVNGLLDVARNTYKQANADAYKLVTELGEETHNLKLELKYDTLRQYYIQIPISELEDRELPEVFSSPLRRKKFLECQTLDLKKWNQKILDSHNEVLQMSDGAVQDLIDAVREEIEPLFKACDAIAMLDMLGSFAQLATTLDYCRPEITKTLAVKSGRHPILEKIHSQRYIPNDAYASQQSRFQIITGCNMSGKSTYIRSLAFMAVMAQIGSFVPASYASFPIFHQLFARVSMDDCIEANMSTFAAEMRETAFILRNVDERSMVIIDELGRGTSTRDGISIAIAIAEALVDSRALVWFVTHFRDLAIILGERNGVVNLHLAVELDTEKDRMTMLYRIANGYVQEKHYGLALAKVVGLPPDVLQVAEKVSKALVTNAERRKRGSKAIAISRRRKLVLNLKEQLTHAKEGNMKGKVLWTWLKNLQDEFVSRMAAVNKDIEAAQLEANQSCGEIVTPTAAAAADHGDGEKQEGGNDEEEDKGEVDEDEDDDEEEEEEEEEGEEEEDEEEDEEGKEEEEEQERLSQITQVWLKNAAAGSELSRAGSALQGGEYVMTGALPPSPWSDAEDMEVDELA